MHGYGPGFVRYLTYRRVTTRHIRRACVTAGRGDAGRSTRAGFMNASRSLKEVAAAKTGECMRHNRAASSKNTNCEREPRSPRSGREVTAAAPLTLSVAICTRNRPDELVRALRSLTRQSLTDMEILVIDNAPSGGATHDAVSTDFPAVRYVVEPVAGLNVARNRALHEARGDVVAFLDDDAVADPHWGATVLSVFDENPNVGVCTGRVEPFSTRSPGERAFEANGGFSRGLQSIRLPGATNLRLHGVRAPLIAWAVSVGSGCNFAVRRDLALALGGFDDALDMGAFLPGGGDHDMLWRVLCAGHEALYEPTALALHEHRRELSATYEQIVGHQRALVAWLTKVVSQSRGGPFLSATCFLAWRVMKPSIRLIRRAVGRDPLPVPVLFSMWWACCRALRVYPLARRVAEERRREAA